MKFVPRDLDKEKLLGFRLLKKDKFRPDRMIGEYIIGARVGNGGKGQPD